MRRAAAVVASALALAVSAAVPAADTGSRGVPAPQLTRGPYLQLGTPTSVVVRWRTDVASEGRVLYGASPAALDQLVDEGQTGTEHQVTLQSLAPDTAYFYAVGTTLGAIHAGGDQEHRFVTAPTAGSVGAYRIWVLGDSGTANANARAVRDAFDGYAGAREPDLWLMLGDNAYPDGTDAEYQAAVFETYPRHLRRQVLWPALGNHDGHSSLSATQTGPFFDVFTLPTQGEAGGAPSMTEAYYSFDYGHLHFVVLDSHDSDRTLGSDMLIWLEDDLMATTAPWIVALWHHPPYSKGSHDSDDPKDSGGRMEQMRENVLPILEIWGVDLVLTGHSHAYERSFLLDGHYGSSSTLAPGHILDGGDGRLAGDGAYHKPTAGPSPHEGAVYVVAGSSGQTGGGSLDHPVMFVSFATLGSLVLDVEANLLRGAFVRSDGTVGDRFGIVKGEDPVVFVDDFESGGVLRWDGEGP